MYSFIFFFKTIHKDVDSLVHSFLWGYCYLFKKYNYYACVIGLSEFVFKDSMSDKYRLLIMANVRNTGHVFVTEIINDQYQD